ncbi:hypothetical protein GLOIN_2v1080634 [Rhizophagus irregularis DAOM 181602=DAOM 197198]|nr:hypothetical protein GLOIN_2v1080634 [Rhizophagus irregularis DAOM 181602=DAOM 197198]
MRYPISTVSFSLLVVVYLVNLFIGLLNNEDNESPILKQMTEVLAEIELFYLLSNQGRWKSWFCNRITIFLITI